MDEHLLTQQQMEAIQKNGFKTEMFGFHRAQVLSYLESLSQQYAQQEAELRARAEALAILPPRPGQLQGRPVLARQTGRYLVQ